MKTLILKYLEHRNRPNNQIRTVIINAVDNYESFRIIERMTDEQLYEEGIIKKEVE